VLAGGVGDVGPAQHARDLLDSGGLIERLDPRAGGTRNHRLGHAHLML